MVPFLLPGMHERYFFLADVTTVLLACYVPRLWFVPLLVQASSLLSYQPYLFGRVVPVLPTIAALLMLAALTVVAHRLLSEAFRRDPIEEELSRLVEETPELPLARRA